MPHVVIEEASDLAGACRALAPFTTRNGDQILKLLDVYLNQSGHTALLDCVVIDKGAARAFFIQLAGKPGQITVRLLPATDPEKTDAVKSLMALVALKLREIIPGSRFGKTNLQAFLSPPEVSEAGVRTVSE